MGLGGLEWGLGAVETLGGGAPEVMAPEVAAPDRSPANEAGPAAAPEVVAPDTGPANVAAPAAAPEVVAPDTGPANVAAPASAPEVVAPGGPANVAGEGGLPDARLIGERGPMMPWSGAIGSLERSVAHPDPERAVEILAPALNTPLTGLDVHMDRPAWDVARTYNADAAVVGTHIYIHRDLEERVVPELNGGSERPIPNGGLVVPEARPAFLKHPSSEIVQTHGGYVVEMLGHEVLIYDRTGDCITRIWGDPHVDENGDGKDDWHFGEDSTFILPDGTKLCLDTEPNEVGEWYTVGVDVLAGAQRFHYGVGDEGGMTLDAADWDRLHADRSKDSSAGVFALGADNQWAIRGEDGEYYDIQSESWSEYLNDRDIDYDTGKRAEGITAAQRR